MAPNVATTLTFQLSVSDQFGTGTDTANVTVKSPVDTLSNLTATWRASQSRGRVGIFNATVNGSDPTATLTISEVSNVTGGSKVLGTMNSTNQPPGTFVFNSSGVDTLGPGESSPPL